jgi:DNA-binding NarL/FixJ family response regulator
MVETDIRVVLIEDQRETREGLATLIGGSPGFKVAGRYAAGEEALKRMAGHRPDVILTDLGLPDISGIEVVARARELLPGTPILVLTVHAEDQKVFESLCAGACGYLLKDVAPARLLEAIRELHAGGSPMSPEIARRVVLMFQKLAPPPTSECRLPPRELEVLQLLAEGYSYRGCADRLSLSLDTVRFYIRHIYERLHVHSKSQAVVKALKSGLIF